MVVLRLRDLFKVASGELRLQVENKLQIYRHPFILDCVLPVDLAHHYQRVVANFEPDDSECCCHPETSNDCFLFGLIISGRGA